MMELRRMTSAIRSLALGAAAMALSGCISFGEDPPPVLFDLTPTSAVASGTDTVGTADQAIGLVTPEAPAKLMVARVPVQVNASNVAYLQDAVWVDRPAKLFASLLGQTLRARSGKLVIDGGDGRFTAGQTLSGTLREMGYDATRGEVVVRYDAVLTDGEGGIRTRRFESSTSVPAEASLVAPALNTSANVVAVEVADWVMANPPAPSAGQ